MIRLHIRKGLLGESGRETVAIEARPGLTARALLHSFRPHLPQSIQVEVAVDGERCAGEDLDKQLHDNQDVMLLPTTTAGVDIAAYLIYALIMVAVSFGVNYLMSVLSPRPKPPGVPADRGDETSATYAWDGIQTNFGQGFPVPWVYGEHGIGGQVVHTDIFASDNNGAADDKLRIILALCEGPIAAVGNVTADEIDDLGGTAGGGSGLELPDDIRINGNLLENGSTAVTVTNLLLGPWTIPPALYVGQVLFVTDITGVLIATTQVLELRNGSPSDLDLQDITGSSAGGYKIKTGQFTGVPEALILQWSPATRTNTTPGARAWIRPGTLDQRPLPSNPFRGTSTAFSPNLQLANQNEEALFTYAGTEAISAATFVMAFPGGLYTLDPQGNLLAYAVVFQFDWRPVGDTAWRRFYVGTGQVQFRTVSRGQLSPALYSAQLSLGPPGADPQEGPIEFRVARRSPAGGTGTVSAATWRNLNLGTDHVLAYPRVALLGLELSAGARFSGGLPQITVKIKGALVRVWDATNGFSPRCWDRPAAPFDFMPANAPPGRNPAWVLLDFLTSPWGLGKFVRDADIDLPAFRRWSAFCDTDPSPLDPWNEPAFQVDLVGDQPRPAWEWVLAICAAGRASPIMRDGKISIVYQYRDAHGDTGITVEAKQPLQLLNAGNCEAVQVTFMPKANRPTVYQFQFLNAENLYAQDVFPVEDNEGTLNEPDALGKEEWRPETIQAYGITRRSQLFREGRWRHRVQRKIRREVSLITGRWALAAEAGDVVLFQANVLRPFDDVPVSMTIRAGGTAVTSITVDHAAAGATAITVRDPDGVPQTAALSSPVVVGKTTTFTCSPALTCNPGAPCVVGVADKLVEPYEVVGISLTKDTKREVRMVQWEPTVHDPITPTEYENGGLTDDIADTQLLLSQPAQGEEPSIFGLRIAALRAGDHAILWAKPETRRNSTARVYVREVAIGGDWTLAGETATDSIVYAGFAPFVEYQVSVCAADVNGQHPLPEAGELLVFHAEEFQPFAPPELTDATATALDDYVELEWDALDVRDLHHYEVRLGSQWTAAEVLHRGQSPRVLLGNPPGGGTVMIAAASTSGLYGNPVVLTLPTWAPRNKELLFDVDEIDLGPAGTHDGTQVHADGYIELEPGETVGTYTGPEQDVTYQGPVYWQVLVDRAEIELCTINDWAWPIGSGEANWWTLQGRPASPCKPGIDWQTTIDDLDMPIDDLPSSLRIHGHVGETGSHTRCFVESRFEIGGVWSAWRKHRDRTVVARKMQVRVTLNRATDHYEPRVTGLAYRAFI